MASASNHMGSTTGTDISPFNWDLIWPIVPACLHHPESQLSLSASPSNFVSSFENLIITPSIFFKLETFIKIWTCRMPHEISLPFNMDPLTSSLLGTFSCLGYVSPLLPIGLHERSHQILCWSPNAPHSHHFPHWAGKKWIMLASRIQLVWQNLFLANLCQMVMLSLSKCL